MKIGIDLGGSHIAVGLVAEEGKILLKKQINITFKKSDKNDIYEEIRDNIISLINHVLKETQVPIFVVEEIGIGIPGIVENNTIIKCDKYGIKNWDIAKEIQEQYQIPARVQNDAMCAAKAEKEYGNLRKSKKSVFICLGTGIGGATILNNKVFSSEYGHMIIEKEGNECNCGNNGCFETYASMKMFKNRVIEILQINKETTSEEILSILKEQKENKKLDQYIDEYIDNLLIGISNIINIVNPETICIGGSFVYYEDILYSRLMEKIKSIKYQFEQPKIVLAKLENNAGIIGATL